MVVFENNNNLMTLVYFRIAVVCFSLGLVLSKSHCGNLEKSWKMMTDIVFPPFFLTALFKTRWMHEVRGRVYLVSLLNLLVFTLTRVLWLELVSRSVLTSPSSGAL